MEDDSLTFALSTPSTNYPSTRKSHFEEEVFIDFEEGNGEDELMTVYPCPYCTEDLDLLELCCHIDLDHPIESNSGICPVCATWVVTNMVDHITAQHGDIFKSLLKSKRYKHEFNPIHSFSRKDQEDEPWQSFSAGLSPAMSTSKSAHDPLLSFLYSGAADDECENVRPDTSSEVSSIEEIHSEESPLERDVQPSLSDKDHIEKARRSEFVQGLLMSTILDSDF
ncbi:PREDICTED: protein DEHYDRATION-INDUCED 19 homolog 5-like [Lupinus angustifolius]|nr:PREDICTED: protein DEHYDRATION-INDUCED 19 homolog 5-like [Lupinus angustifolius]